MDLFIKWNIYIRHDQFCRIFSIFLLNEKLFTFLILFPPLVFWKLFVFQFKPGKNLQKSVADGSFLLFYSFGLENGE